MAQRKGPRINGRTLPSAVDDDDDDEYVDLEAGSGGERHDPDEDSLESDSSYESDSFLASDSDVEDGSSSDSDDAESSSSDSDDDDGGDRRAKGKRGAPRRPKKSDKKHKTIHGDNKKKASGKKNKTTKSGDAGSDSEIDASVAALSGMDVDAESRPTDAIASDDRDAASATPQSAIGDDAVRAFDVACPPADDIPNAMFVGKTVTDVSKLLGSASASVGKPDNVLEASVEDVRALTKWVRYVAHRVFAPADATLEAVVEAAISDDRRAQLQARLELARDNHSSMLALLTPMNEDTTRVLDRQSAKPTRVWPFAALLQRLLRTVALHADEVVIEAPAAGQSDYHCHVTNRALRAGDRAFLVTFVTDARLMSEKEVGSEGVDRLVRDGRAAWLQPESRHAYVLEHAYVAQHATKRKRYYVDMLFDFVAFAQTQRHLVVALCAWRAERPDLRARDAGLACVKRFAADDGGFTAQFVTRFVMLRHIVWSTIMKLERRKSQ